MSETDPVTYEDFWPSYVRAHSKPLTRIFHAVGTTAALGCLTLAALTRRKALVPLALVAGYGPAWVSHFFIEDNRPASFKHPLWSLRGDFDMLSRMLQGTMAAEVERCMAMVSTDNPSPTPTAEAVATNGSTNGHGDRPASATETPDRTFH